MEAGAEASHSSGDTVTSPASSSASHSPVMSGPTGKEKSTLYLEHGELNIEEKVKRPLSLSFLSFCLTLTNVALLCLGALLNIQDNLT